MTVKAVTAPDQPTGLLEALLAFQVDPPHIPLDSENPHFRSRFASLPNVLKIVRPKLAAVGLVWTTLPGHVNGVGPVLRYRLAHAATGEALDGEMPLMVVKSDPQGLGSAITYARRYSLLAVLDLAGDEDDDGNSASGDDGTDHAAASRQAPGARGVATEKQAAFAQKLVQRDKQRAAAWLQKLHIDPVCAVVVRGHEGVPGRDAVRADAGSRQAVGCPQRLPS